MIKKIILFFLSIMPITFFAQVTANFTVNNSDGNYCLNDTVLFTNTSTGDYVLSYWDFGDGVDTWTENPKHVYQSTGSFTVTLTVTDASENTSSTTMTLNINPSPDVSIINNEIEQSLTAVSVNDNLTFKWLFQADTTAETDSVIFYLESGLYTVVATNSYGCSDKASYNVNLNQDSTLNDSLQIIVKNNILTPDLNDGANDVLFIQGLNSYKNPCIVLVYNKWGQLIYYNEEYTNLGGFEGKDNDGNELDAGTYLYVIKSEGRKTTTGYVDLIR